MSPHPSAPPPAWHSLLALARRSSWFVALEERARYHFTGRHQEIYDAAYYEFIEFSAVWSRATMASAIVRDLKPGNLLDVGCGTGALLEALQMRGVEVVGLEYSDAGLTRCQERALEVRKFDLARQRLPKDLRQRDVVISFEVAEHLPPRLADRFIDLLSSASDVAVLSAATPGQGGTDHLNEQPHEYWIEKMAGRGFGFDRELSLRWRAEWKETTANWYHSNVMVFRRPRLWSKVA